MASTGAPGWPSIEAQEYAAAESMLQHSRSGRSNSQTINGFAIAEAQDYGLEATRTQSQVISPVPGQSYPPPFRPPFHSTNVKEQNHSFNGSFEGQISSSHEVHGQFDQTPTDSFSELSQGQNSHISDNSHRANSGAAERDGHSHRNSSLDGSEPTSPRGIRDYTKRQSDWPASWTQRSSNENGGQIGVKEEMDKKTSLERTQNQSGQRAQETATSPVLPVDGKR